VYFVPVGVYGSTVTRESCPVSLCLRYSCENWNDLVFSFVGMKPLKKVGTKLLMFQCNLEKA
jgi:hypothetical protein